MRGRRTRHIITCSAVIFDVDGTLVDSTPVVERIWRAWSVEYGLDAEMVLGRAHGRRSADTIRDIVDADHFEQAVRRQQTLELTDLGDVTAFAGALPLLSALARSDVLQWGLATSLPADLLAARMAAAGLPMPATVVTSDQVTHGKPDPECYLVAARELGLPRRECVVVEDAPAGLRAARSAGATGIAVTHTFPLDALAPYADHVISSLDQLHVTDRGMAIEDGYEPARETC
jgi:mannitol-1-/sugar-/sorbitol-6-phosphatase